VTDCVPARLGERAAAGEIDAGLLPLAEFLRQEDRFERIGPFGIAVRGRAQSALLFSRKPLQQLDGATIGVTEETSTTVRLLRLLLEQRYHCRDLTYVRGRTEDVDALLLIGDEALRVHQANTFYPYETDVAFEWWLWQHLPFVFAVWAIRRDAEAEVKKQLELAVAKALARNQGQLPVIAQEASKTLPLPAEALHAYLARFVYRFGPSEGEAIARFRELTLEHAVL